MTQEAFVRGMVGLPILLLLPILLCILCMDVCLSDDCDCDRLAAHYSISSLT